MTARVARLVVALGLLLGAAVPSPAGAAAVRLTTSQQSAASPVPARGADPVYARSYFGARYYRADLGRFTTVDPAMTIEANLLAPQRWNRYAYVRNNPLRWVDPDGRDIKALYDRKSGILTIADVDTGKTVVIKVESGGKPFGDPIPTGSWDILERHGKRDFFRLDKQDQHPYDDKDDQTGRTLFRLHKPGMTIGCIAAKDWSEWKEARALIEATKTTVVPDNAVPWWHLKSETVVKYGTLVVR